MPQKTIIFFGSFQHYSTIVASALKNSRSLDLVGVVTTPPQNIIIRGKKVLRKTHTHQWAVKNKMPVFTPETLNSNSLKSLPPVDYFLTAGYSKKLPPSWLNRPRLASLNLHFSLLPKYRGANPAEWAIMRGEKKTGVTLIKMDQGIDTGPIITQKSLPILPTDTRETLYDKLYHLAATLITSQFTGYEPVIITQPQPKHSPTPYAKRLTRQDGFVPWPQIKSAFEINHFTPALERKIRAFAGFPGVWTLLRQGSGGQAKTKRLKILSSTQVQLEGKQPSTYNQIKNQLE